MTIGDFFTKHKGVRRLTLLWMVILITAVTIKVFWFPPAGPMLSALYLELLGLMTIVIGFYNYTRGKEDASSGDNT